MGLFRVFLLQSYKWIGLDWVGYGMGWMGWDLCVGLLYEHRFAMLISTPRHMKEHYEQNEHNEQYAKNEHYAKYEQYEQILQVLLTHLRVDFHFYGVLMCTKLLGGILRENFLLVKTRDPS